VSKRRILVFVLALALILVVALLINSCGSIDTAFEDLPGLPADYENRTYFVEGDAPGALKVITGKREAGGYWGEGGGLIAEDIKVLWSRSLNWPLMRWPNVKRDEVKEIDPPEGSHRSFLVKYVSSSFITVSWTMKWIHTITDGTPEDPRRIVIQFQKVKGTGFIKHWKGSYVLTRVRPGHTSFAMRSELSATAQGEKACRTSVTLGHRKFLTGK